MTVVEGKVPDIRAIDGSSHLNKTRNGKGRRMVVVDPFESPH
jgi:hypothetical protein